MNGLLPYKYNDKKKSPWGGMKLIKELYDRVGLFDNLRSLPLQNLGSAIGAEHYEIIESFIISVILSARNRNNVTQIRYDEVLKEI